MADPGFPKGWGSTCESQVLSKILSHLEFSSIHDSNAKRRGGGVPLNPSLMYQNTSFCVKSFLFVYLSKGDQIINWRKKTLNAIIYTKQAGKKCMLHERYACTYKFFILSIDIYFTNYCKSDGLEN